MDNNQNFGSQDNDVTVLVDQTAGVPVYPGTQQDVSRQMNQTGYGEQQPYGQQMAQPGYQNMQQPYGQQMGQTGYPNQQPYGQQMGQTGYPNQQPYGQQTAQPGYQNMQQPYGQQMAQPGYQNMQQPYGQQMNQGYQNNYAGGNNMTPGKTININPKVLIIAVAIIAVVVLGIIFIPKLFNSDSKTPFKGIEPGMDRDEVVKIIGAKDDGDEYLYANVKAFGVEGRLQMNFSGDEFNRANWYVDEEDCKSEKAYDKAVEAVIDYYTDEYGKPDKENDGDMTEYTWEDDNGNEYQLEVEDDEFVLRYR